MIKDVPTKMRTIYSVTLTEHIVHEIHVRAVSADEAIKIAEEKWIAFGPERFSVVDRDITDWNAAPLTDDL